MQLDIAGPAGRLEAIYRAPPAPRFAAAVAHPHPLHGGTLHNHATYRLGRAVLDAGGAVVRFNFRGVGRSAGTHDHGRGEREDMKAALRFIAERHPGLPLLACGFSFGSWMALEAGCELPEVRAILCAGLALRLREAAVELARACEKPVAVVQAAGDAFGSPAEVEEVLRGAAGPRRLAVVEGATHLFTERLQNLAREATLALDWLLAPASARRPEAPSPATGAG